MDHKNYIEKDDSRLSDRVLSLERALILGNNNNSDNSNNSKDVGTGEYGEEEHDGLLRSRLAVSVRYKLHSACWHWVPKDLYYAEWNLQDHQMFLKAPSIHCLCKSMLMEYLPSKFVLCIVQYTSSLDTKLISIAIRQHNIISTTSSTTGTAAIPKNIQMASESDNFKLTGYIHNAVTPIGMTHQHDIPILLSSSILLLQQQQGGRMYLGGGHPFCKLSLSVNEFVQKVPNVYIANISTPRTTTAPSPSNESSRTRN